MLSLHSGPRRWSRHRTERSDKGAVGRPHSARVDHTRKTHYEERAEPPRIKGADTKSSEVGVRAAGS
jgi:hypothetical protein